MEPSYPLKNYYTEVIKVEIRELCLAYLAGILDGEGTMGVYKISKHLYDFRFAVVNTNIELLEWIKVNFGGSITVHYKGDDIRKRSWKWKLSDKTDIYKLCKVILTFLIVKKDICKLVIEAYEDTFHWDYQRGGNKYGIRIPEYAINKREEYYQRTLELNHRGPIEGSKSLEPKLKRKTTTTLEEYE